MDIQCCFLINEAKALINKTPIFLVKKGSIYPLANGITVTQVI